MSRYPFMAAVNSYLDDYFGVYAEGMYDELSRRYPKIHKQILYLYENGQISTTNPEFLTVDDVKAYTIYQRDRGLKNVSISHDLSAIKNLCLYMNGNNCVDEARKKYPILFPKRKHILLPVLELPQYTLLTAPLTGLSPAAEYLLIRAAAETMLVFGAGLRTQELQHSKLRFLDHEFRFIYLDHVKGMDSYGQERIAPIRPEARPMLELWRSVRDSRSEYLFPNELGNPLSLNTLTKDRNRIIKLTGIKYDFRMGRRTYAQYLIDEGIHPSEVAIALGHTSSKTTEQSYARPRPDRVVRKIIDHWAPAALIENEKEGFKYE